MPTAKISLCIFLHPTELKSRQNAGRQRKGLKYASPRCKNYATTSLSTNYVQMPALCISFCITSKLQAGSYELQAVSPSYEPGSVPVKAFSLKLGKQAPCNMLTSRKYETAVVLLLKDWAVSTLTVSQSFLQSKQALSGTRRQAAVVEDNKEASWRSQGQR